MWRLKEKIMKKAVLKTIDVILTIIMIVSALYAVFNLVMTFLPIEVQTQVYGWLNMSEEYIATFSISSVINAAVLVSSKLIQTYSRISLTNTLNQAENTINENLAVDAAVVNRVNSMIDNQKAIQALLEALLSVQKVTTERNIKASEKLVNKAEKEAYKSALEQIKQVETQLEELKNITSVYERTETKEVIVEKEVDSLSGRV